MEKFRYVDDVEKWLKPMNYEQFWRETKPYCLAIERRSTCDAQIESGLVSQEDVLYGLKVMAEYNLTKRHRLTRKPATPWLKVVGEEQ